MQPPNLPSVNESQSRSKVKENRQGQSKAAGSERFKTIVRRLPPNLPEQIYFGGLKTLVPVEIVGRGFILEHGKSEFLRQNHCDFVGTYRYD